MTKILIQTFMILSLLCVGKWVLAAQRDVVPIARHGLVAGIE